MRQPAKIVALALGLVVVAAASARAADATPNDTARFLAGMAPAADSPLAPLTKDRAWQQHAKFFDNAFAQLEQRQLGKIRTWTKAHVTESRPTLFYMFSGPDFLYADAFFPNATTYVLAGLEPPGSVPDMLRLSRGLGSALSNVERSLSTILAFSFFITRHMRSDLNSGTLNGTLPILYVFLARAGKTVRDVTLVTLDDQGNIRTDGLRTGSNTSHGVKIEFAGSDGVAKTLYYFSTNLANDGVRSSGFLKFCVTLAPGDAFFKSASYLPHSPNFTVVRDFILNNAATVIQDDSGIPLAYYDRRKWQLSPFGRYAGPIGEFPGRYQPQYEALFAKSPAIDFGIGYRWRPHESNLLLAKKLETPLATAPEEPPPVARPAKSQRRAKKKHPASGTGWFSIFR